MKLPAGRSELYVRMRVCERFGGGESMLRAMTGLDPADPADAEVLLWYGVGRQVEEHELRRAAIEAAL